METLVSHHGTLRPDSRRRIEEWVLEHFTHIQMCVCAMCFPYHAQLQVLECGDSCLEKTNETWFGCVLSLKSGILGYIMSPRSFVF